MGYFDGMRVSADTGPTWKPEVRESLAITFYSSAGFPPPNTRCCRQLPMPWWDQANLPCVRSMVRNSVSRAGMSHRFWINDPDCLLLRESTKLSTAEVISTVSVVGMTSGMLLLSDDMGTVSASRARLVEQIVPCTNTPAIVMDAHTRTMPRIMRLVCSDVEGSGSQRGTVEVAQGLGTWSVVSLSNWSDKKARVGVPLDALKVDGDGKHGFHTFNVWTNMYKYQAGGERTRFSCALASHQTEILVVKPVVPDKAGYIGSTFHFTSGFEVSSVTTTSSDENHGSLKLEFKTGHSKSEGCVFFFLPHQWEEGMRDDTVILHINNRATKGENLKSAAHVIGGTVFAVKCGLKADKNKVLHIIW